MADGASRAAEAAEALTRGLLAAEILLTRPDHDGTPGSPAGRPHSAEPWNAAAGAVVMTVHQGVRDLEAQLLTEAGLPARGRGGSLANTIAAVKNVVILAGNLTGADAAVIAGQLGAWAGSAERLPAVDERARWIPLRAGGKAPSCPFCHTYSLRMSERSGMIACFCPDCPCVQAGDRIVGHLAWSAVQAAPVLVWFDREPAELCAPS